MTHFRRGLIFGIVCLLCIAAYETKGWSESPVPAATISSVDKEQYLLQPGDRVSIKIYPEDEFIKGGEMEISSEGNITLPLVGKIKITGKTVVEAQQIVSEILSKDYLVSPETVIEVLQYKKHSFVILGQVKKPGTYEIPPGMTSFTLLQAISLGGGFSDIANVSKIKIMRKGSGGNQIINANAEAIMSGNEPDVELQPGDVIHVSESLF